MPTFTGTAGYETITGTDQDDIIDGLGGGDTLYGMGGNDVIRAGPGRTTVLGGDGDDTVVLTPFALTQANSTNDNNQTAANGGAGFDTLDMTGFVQGQFGLSIYGTGGGVGVGFGFSPNGRQVLANSPGFERILGGLNARNEFLFNGPTGNMELVGGNLADDFNLSSGTGRYIVRAGGGDDSVRIRLGDRVEAGDGNDGIALDNLASFDGLTWIDGGAGIDILNIFYSVSGVLSLEGSRTAQTGLQLFDIENLIVSTATTLSIVGSAANNRITVGGRTTVDGGAGDDVLISQSGDATLIGGTGNDILQGSALRTNPDGSRSGIDRLFGGAGDDFIYGWFEDILDGGAGTDTIAFVRDDFAQVEVNLATGFFGVRGSTQGGVLSGFENVQTGARDDLIVGDDGANVLDAGGGDDVINAGGGNDRIIGGSGNDTIDGGAGVDTAVFNYSVDRATFSYEGGRIIVQSTEGRDSLINVERLEFSDALLEVGADGRVVLQPLNVIQGTAANDTLVGTAGRDRILGADGADVLIGGANFDVLDGGGGIDTAGYSGLFRAYAVGRGGGALTSVAGGPEGGTDSLISIERLSFLDGVLDTNASGASAQIYRLYGTALGRAPDQAGLSAWVGALAAGTTLVQAAQGFAGSAEFLDRFGTLSNDAFVRKIYQLSLNREGDSGGIAHWTSELNRGVSRGELVTAFSESAEYRGLTAAAVSAGLFVQDDRTVAVARLYDAAFDRVPDFGGLAHWRGTLDAGGSLVNIANAFVSSQEFQDRYGALNNAQFIEQLYRFTLNREADPGGRQVWLDALNSGTSRAQIVVTFSESLEHIGLTGGLWENGVRYEGYVAATSALAPEWTGNHLEALVLPDLQPDASDAHPVLDGMFGSPSAIPLDVGKTDGDWLYA